MLVTIDIGQLVRDAAVLKMDSKYYAEKVCITNALQKQLPKDVDLYNRVRQQVKEYKQLTMWRD
jgi:hypothetical protein